MRLPKSIFSWQCKCYQARRTEVKATNVPCSGAVRECRTDAAMLTRLTPAVCYFQSSAHYPSWAHALEMVILHHRIVLKDQGLFNRKITSESHIPCLLLNYALDRTESWSNLLVKAHKLIPMKRSSYQINCMTPNMFNEHILLNCLCSH